MSPLSWELCQQWLCNMTTKPWPFSPIDQRQSQAFHLHGCVILGMAFHFSVLHLSPSFKMGCILELGVYNLQGPFSVKSLLGNECIHYWTSNWKVFLWKGTSSFAWDRWHIYHSYFLSYLVPLLSALQPPPSPAPPFSSPVPSLRLLTFPLSPSPATPLWDRVPNPRLSRQIPRAISSQPPSLRRGRPGNVISPATPHRVGPAGLRRPS